MQSPLQHIIHKSSTIKEQNIKQANKQEILIYNKEKK